MSENREKPYWEGKHYSFFQNTECEYFPCHRVADPSRFNCLFCYCPLYMLGPRCGGNFRYNKKGIKDCTGCLIPHLPENYGWITGKYAEIAAAMRQAEKYFPGDGTSKLSGAEPGKFSGAETGSLSESGTREEREAESTDTQSDGSDSHRDSSKKKKITAAGYSKTSKKNENPKIVMTACTGRGFDTMRRAAEALAKALPEAEVLQTGRSAYVPGFEDGPKLSEVTSRWFHEADALIYFTATGIAVRCIAPFAQDKFRDPAVLTVDENGRFVISLMSGHAGGANRLGRILADAIGAQSVITTATDGRGLFAVDVFASEQGLQISDRNLAKQISARILAGETISIFFDKEFSIQSGDSKPAPEYLMEDAESGRTEKRSFELTESEKTEKTVLESSESGKAEAIFLEKSESGRTEKTVLESSESGKTEETVLETSESGKTEKTGSETIECGSKDILKKYGDGVCRTMDRSGADIIVSCRSKDNDRKEALYLIPRAVSLGIGCRKGIGAEAIERAVLRTLKGAGVFRRALCGVASIDLKKEEPGLHAFAQKWELPVVFYSAEELNELPGTFSASGFVRGITGVDCVCERSAVRLAMEANGSPKEEGSAVRLAMETNGSPEEEGSAVRLAMEANDSPEEEGSAVRLAMETNGSPEEEGSAVRLAMEANGSPEEERSAVRLAMEANGTVKSAGGTRQKGVFQKKSTAYLREQETGAVLLEKKQSLDGVTTALAAITGL